jgi:tetratricopeptide (TPR) repeat protein
LASSRKAAEEALAIERQVGNKSMEAYALHNLASVLVSEGNLADGRTTFQNAVALRNQLGEKVTEAESWLALAYLRLDSGDATGAEAEASRTALIFHDTSALDDEAISYSLLALALIAQGKSEAAHQAARTAHELSPKVTDASVRLQVEIADPYVTGMVYSVSAPSNWPEVRRALQTLEICRNKASGLGLVGLELEARLRLSELENRSGRTASVRARINELRNDAHAKGFLLIARKAEALSLPNFK